MIGAKSPFVSVIIPVFNDSERLGLCLAALAEQTYGRPRFEIIVVDNGSDDLDLIKALVASYDNATLAIEPIPGSYAARNRGLEIAKGEAIAFTDADCIPAADWLEQGVAHLCSSPNCGQVVGRVNLFFADPQRPTAAELYESLTAFPQERLLREQHGGATANVFTWRRVIDHVGNFNSQMKSYGDIEWGERVYKAGYGQVYADDVQVGHPARRSLAELHKRTARQAGGIFDRFIKSDDSFIQRQKMFARLLLDDLTPPVNFFITTFSNPDLKRWSHKLKAALVIIFVRYVSAGEKIRLKLGGVSNRG